MGRIGDNQRSREELLAELQELRARVRAAERSMGMERPGNARFAAATKHLEMGTAVMSAPVELEDERADGRRGSVFHEHVGAATSHAGEAEQRYRSVADSDMLGVVFSDAATGLISESNEAFLRLIGRERGEIETGRLHWRDLTPPHYIPVELLIQTELLRWGTSAKPRQRTLLHSDGHEVPVLIRAAFSDEGRTTIVSCVLDLTEQRRSETALKLSEQRLRSILENTAAIVWVKDLEGRYQLVNRSWEAIYRAPASRIVGKTDYDFFPREIAEVFRANDRMAVEGGGSIECEETTAQHDGLHTHLSVKFPLRDESGKIYAVCGISTDITDRKRQEEELREAKNAAEAASRSKDEFLAMLSHELRTPLMPVMLGLEALARNESLEARVRADLEMMEGNVQLQARLIDDLLDVMRISHRKLELRLEPLDLHTIIEQAMRTCESEAAEKGIALRVELSGTRSQVRGDAARLQQVFWNLLQNALKFTPQGGAVTIRTLGAGNGIRAEVADTGIGIAPQVLERIFEPLEQGDRSITRRFGGLGLGLAICRGVMHMHGGIITAASEGAGKGSTFAIELPLATAEELRPRSDVGSASSQAVRSLRILLVEDHDSTAELLCRLLGGCGHQVVATENVAAALREASLQQFDLVISDLGLPDGDGNELMTRLSRLYGLRGIALSGYGQPEDLRRSKEAGFAMHLVKPVDLAQVNDAIGRVMG